MAAARSPGSALAGRARLRDRDAARVTCATSPGGRRSSPSTRRRRASTRSRAPCCSGRTTKAIPAEVLEQAVVGSIRIVEGERKFFGGVQAQGRSSIDPSRADGDGRLLLAGCSPGCSRAGVRVRPAPTPGSRRRRRTSSRLANVELVRRGLRREVPVSARAWPVLAAIGAGALVFFAAMFALSTPRSTRSSRSCSSSAPGWSLFIVIGLVSRKPLTAAGAEVRDHLKGLKEFIEWAEADRIRMLQSPMGAERVRIDTRRPRADAQALRGAAAVRGRVRAGEAVGRAARRPLRRRATRPAGTRARSGFSAGSFSSGISSLSASSASSSSTSGGSGGGGSSGGGGGGGGGGGV